MALTLDQYADFLDTRELTWPVPPPIEPPKAKPHWKPLRDVRAVTWNLYGTLLHISTGELLFEHPNKFVMDVALEKTVQEFKMWGSMTRKAGQPSEYMAKLYAQELAYTKLAPSPGEKFPEIAAEKIWERLLKKLLQKEYKWDEGFFGSQSDYSRKIAYFFHTSLQGTDCYPDGMGVLEHIRGCGVRQGLIADGQCFTMTQLRRGLAQQGGSTTVDEFFPGSLRSLSFDVRGRKPSERLFRPVLEQLAKQGITPEQVLHVGSRIVQDIVPAKKLGMRTALFAGDAESVQATPEQLKDAATKPNILLTELKQLKDVIEPV
jgi:FMN phosphatase YigB (HAD superfamily)